MTGTCLYVPIHFLPFFFFFFLLSSRNIVRSCNRVSEGKKAGQTILIAQEQDERWPTFFFDVKERKKPRGKSRRNYYNTTLREEPKDHPWSTWPFFLLLFIYIYMYVYLLFYIYADFKFDLNLSSFFLRFFRSSRDPSSLFSILLLTTLTTSVWSCLFSLRFFSRFFSFISSKTSCQSLPFLNEDMLKSQLRTSRGILLTDITYKVYIRHPMLDITDDWI